MYTYISLLDVRQVSSAIRVLPSAALRATSIKFSTAVSPSRRSIRPIDRQVFKHFYLPLLRVTRYEELQFLCCVAAL